MLQTYSEDSEDPATIKVSVFFSKVILIINIIIFLFASHSLIFNYETFVENDIVLALILPILLTIWLIPYIYGLAVYSSYETWFVSVLFSSNKDQEVYKLRRNLIIEKCSLNLSKINYIKKKLHVFVFQSEEDFRIALNELDEEYKLL